MKILWSWLQELVSEKIELADITSRLSLSGLEVESVTRLDKGLENVVAAVVRERTPIEGTKLSICKVFDGELVHQIVCGAQNYSAGSIVPMAKVGAVLPDGKAIGHAKLRGIESFGMLCSSRELGFDNGVDGLWILDENTVVGTPIAQIMGKNDVLLDVNVTPDRADALSHIGVARDVCALLKVPLRLPKTALFQNNSTKSTVHVDIQAPALCSLFATRLIENVTVQPSPKWLQNKIESLGQRSINNIVDATNFVMFECGQPSHAYDASKIENHTLFVRTAKQGESLQTLDAKTHTLTTSDLVIADANGPVGLAGVMGGKSSEVTSTTTSILLECAHFSPVSVRATARRYGIHSESSHRFERNVDSESTIAALDRLTQIILEIAGGRVVGNIEMDQPTPYLRPTVKLTAHNVVKLSGLDIPWDEAHLILDRLGFECISNDGRESYFKIPARRQDVSIEADLISEVMRIHGYEKIPLRLPDGSGSQISPDLKEITLSRIAQTCAANGFDETVHFAFISESDAKNFAPHSHHIHVKNPLIQDQAVMRPSLIPGLLKTLAHNLRQGAKHVQLYESGRIYETLEKSGDSFQSATYKIANEVPKIAFVGYGSLPSSWLASKQEPFGFYDLKAVFEQLFETLKIPDFKAVSADQSIAWLHPRSAAYVSGGCLGELHPTLAESYDLPRGVFVGELDVSFLVEHATVIPQTTELPKFPASTRDLAIVVQESLTAANLEQEIWNAADESSKALVQSVRLFDVYRGPQLPKDTKNVAFSIRYQSAEKTLTDEEVNTIHGGIVKRLSDILGASLRA